MAFLTIDGLRLHYETAGHGPSVLLIHGWASSWRMWARSMSRLAQAGYRAWAVDLIGFGASDKPGSDWYGLERFTQTLIDFCDRLGVDRPALAGHSLGGTIALDVAARRDARSLVAVAPIVNGELGLPLRQLWTSPLARRLFGGMHKRAFFSVAGDMRLLALPGLYRDLARKRMHQDLRATTVNAAVGSLRAVVTSNLQDRLPMIHAPTLVLAGGRDTTVPPSQGRLAARSISGARLVVWPDVGHQVVDERGDDFDALLIDHLDRACGRRTGRTAGAGHPLQSEA